MSVVSVARPSRLVWRRAGRGVWGSVTLSCRFLARLGKGAWYSRLWLATCYVGWLTSLFVVAIDSRAAYVGMWVALALWVVPLVVGVLWSLVNPFTFDRWVAGPWRRHQWRRWARKNWDELARECGLSVQRTRVEKVTRKIRVGDHTEYVREPREVKHWVAPYLSRVETRGDLLVLRVRARIGQTLEEIEAAVPALQVAAAATSGRCAFVSECQVEVQLMMRNALASGREASIITRDDIDTLGVVAAGRTQSGATWRLQVIGRHTLIVGASGSGKGSPMWSVVGNLAPAVPTGEVQLWGIDLKHGLELSMGKQLFCCMATTPTQALEVLRQLHRVIEARGSVMAGVSRLHQPRPGDPLHVLVIDELAVLTSYGPPEVVKEASRLLSEVLTQGRALGVVVLAAVQDPRKEIVGMRNLFTQALALRLNSSTETRMVLGDETTRVAPAHRILRSQQGTGWIQDEDGTFDKVRADYWPDKTIREVARLYPSPVVVELPTEQQVAEAALSSAPKITNAPDGNAASQDVMPRARKPRAPRKPRQPRNSGGQGHFDKLKDRGEPLNRLGEREGQAA
ncbi:FtsK/SpoIIIE domain-containing protein [Luteococcus sp.]|uniref:FtsK/SpoIIIE domain-containing protein n=1 Tax=Luteococcus sp. TaxID=1969402 RepID=UPI003736823F